MTPRTNEHRTWCGVLCVNNGHKHNNRWEWKNVSENCVDCNQRWNAHAHQNPELNWIPAKLWCDRWQCKWKQFNPTPHQLTDYHHMHACTHSPSTWWLGRMNSIIIGHIFFLRVILCVTNFERVSIVLNQLFHTHQSHIFSSLVQHLKSAFNIFISLNNQYLILDSCIGF